MATRRFSRCWASRPSRRRGSTKASTFSSTRHGARPNCSSSSATAPSGTSSSRSGARTARSGRSSTPRTAASIPRRGEVYYQGILIDITDRKRLEDRLLDQTLRDPLTGCWNRRYLAEFVARHQDAGGSWGCIMVDIDHFKQYNDEFGHEAGDAVLNRVARFLMRATRAEESTVRMGGDEFLLLLDGADAKATENTSERLVFMADRELLVPFSLGWAARDDGETLEKTIARADHRLLHARGLTRSGERPKFVLVPRI